MALRALLLDFDGTLADSLPAMQRVYDRFVTDLGGVPTAAEFERLNGPPLRDVVESLCATHQQRQHNHEDIAAYLAHIEEELVRTRPTEGARLLLERAQTCGIRCGLVTSGKADLVAKWLNANGLSDLCPVVVSGDDVKEGKPSPAPYLLAVDRLGIRADEALAIEDSLAGVAAATSAGIPTLRLGEPTDAATELASIQTLTDALPYLNEACTG